MNHSTDNTKDVLNKGSIIKTIELILIICADILFFCVLMFDKGLRSAVFGNKYLFIMCVITWSVLITALIFILIDYNIIRASVSDTISLSQVAYNDALTGLPNRHSIDLMIRLQNDDRILTSIGCVLVKLSNISTINAEYGHEVGDILIRDFCHLLIAISNNYGFIGRNGGNDFLGIFENCSEDTMNSFISELNDQIHMYNIGHTSTPIEIDYSFILNNTEKADNISDLLTILYRKIK